MVQIITRQTVHGILSKETICMPRLQIAACSARQHRDPFYQRKQSKSFVITLDVGCYTLLRRYFPYTYIVVIFLNVVANRPAYSLFTTRSNMTYISLDSMLRVRGQYRASHLNVALWGCILGRKKVQI